MQSLQSGIFNGGQRQHHSLAPRPVEKASRSLARHGGSSFSFRRDGGATSAREEATENSGLAAQDYRLRARHRRLREAHPPPADDRLSQPRQRSLGQLEQRALQWRARARLNNERQDLPLKRLAV